MLVGKVEGVTELDKGGKEKEKKRTLYLFNDMILVVSCKNNANKVYFVLFFV